MKLENLPYLLCLMINKPEKVNGKKWELLIQQGSLPLQGSNDDQNREFTNIDVYEEQIEMIRRLQLK